MSKQGKIFRFEIFQIRSIEHFKQFLRIPFFCNIFPARYCIFTGSQFPQEIISVIGFDCFMKMCRYYGGTSVYIPTYEHASKGLKRDLIYEDSVSDSSFASPSNSSSVSPFINASALPISINATRKVALSYKKTCHFLYLCAVIIKGRKRQLLGLPV